MISPAAEMRVYTLGGFIVAYHVKEAANGGALDQRNQKPHHKSSFNKLFGTITN
ncbi:MAG: hypothetical protein ABI977_36805 [Acidobacteriota bacterium]